mmetsp:Transcript_40468/g.47362  ORF Transcript_40468/g.47362 Transcript_40468/m.47362 type:complete len:230 (+) Transcript_40468:369-1058(+)
MRKISVLPRRLARQIAVAPRYPRTFKFEAGTLPSNILTTSSFPASAPHINGVLPLSSIPHNSDTDIVVKLSTSPLEAALHAAFPGMGMSYFNNGTFVPNELSMLNDFHNMRGTCDRFPTHISASPSLPPSEYFRPESTSTVDAPAALPKATSFDGLSPTITRPLVGKSIDHLFAIMSKAFGSGLGGIPSGKSRLMDGENELPTASNHKFSSNTLTVFCVFLVTSAMGIL